MNAMLRASLLGFLLFVCCSGFTRTKSEAGAGAGAGAAAVADPSAVNEDLPHGDLTGDPQVPSNAGAGAEDLNEPKETYDTCEANASKETENFLADSLMQWSNDGQGGLLNPDMVNQKVVDCCDDNHLTDDRCAVAREEAKKVPVD